MRQWFSLMGRTDVTWITTENYRADMDGLGGKGRPQCTFLNLIEDVL